MVPVIVIIILGLIALAVLALAVGLFDAAQGGRRRWIARERRASWEQRRRDEQLALTRDRFPEG